MAAFRAEIATTRPGDRAYTTTSLHLGPDTRYAPALRHPGAQHEARPPPPPPARASAGEKQLERMVGVLLRELSETRREKAAKDAQLATYKEEYLSLLRSAASGAAKQQSGRDAPLQRSGGAGGGAIRAFRPPGVAPVPRRGKIGHSTEPADGRHAPSPAALQQAEALASVQLDNAQLRRQLAAVEATCQQLQAHVDAGTAAAALPAPASPRGGHTTTTVMLSSPRPGAADCDLTVAVFEPPPPDLADLHTQLNKLQRENLKLSSKHKAAEAELVTRGITAKRWEEACEAQSAQIAELRVQLEQERRSNIQLQRTIARAGDECDARDEDVTALLEQLRSAEHAASAAQGEAAGLRTQLTQVEGLLGKKQQEMEQLKEHLNATIARLQVSELVRQEAEKERDLLAAAHAHLEQDLDTAQQRADAEGLELRAALTTLQQKLAGEEQRSDMLQAQLALVEQQGRETEAMLTDQLQCVQEERNACLAAATRADALLIKLGSHAVQLGAGG